MSVERFLVPDSENSFLDINRIECMKILSTLCDSSILNTYHTNIDEL